jgi:hypothetical protein
LNVGLNRLSRQPLILTHEEKQRAVARGADGENIPDDDRVIAAVVALRDLALDGADDAVEDRGAVSAGMPLEAAELIDAFGGETLR